VKERDKQEADPLTYTPILPKLWIPKEWLQSVKRLEAYMVVMAVS
jgi:hypothetical protein